MIRDNQDKVGAAATIAQQVMKISIIIPVYNGEATIENLVNSLQNELKSRYLLEIILVNDCSPDDNSCEICHRLASRNRCVKFIDLSRNFSEHNAIMAGLNYCTGDAAVVVHDDFQNPPSEVVKLIDRLNRGYDVVFSHYEKKKHNFIRNIGSYFNNFVATILIDKPFGLYLSSFKIFNRFIIDELVKYKGPYPYIDGLILRVTQNYSTVLVKHDSRKQGESGYTLSKMMGLWLNMFTNSSILPLRIAMGVGFMTAIIGMVGAGIFFFEKLLNPELPVGWASLIISLFVISGIQLCAIGMIGEYLGRLFLKDSGHPQFVVRRIVSCDDSHEAMDD